ncbi:UNVERIFIED_CONTAM: hypothetical protein PYX00_002928 [Menopon gallinae]|uniref:Protein NDNF n=1 Tax=Menopon gallinae TaxID=328185 RepID=A0AAW2HZG2_9NEOP
MVVFDGRVRGKPLLFVLILKFILILAQEDQYRREPIDGRHQLKCGLEDSEKALKANKQMTIHLSEKEITVYHFENVQTHEHTLSVTIIPCSSRIKWSFLYQSDSESERSNETQLTVNGHKENIGEGEDNEMRTVTATRARTGCYFLVLTSLEGYSKVNVYLTMDNGGPFELTIPQNANLLLMPQRKQRLKITWDRSLINPHNTSYCIVVSRKKEFLALCGAEDEGSVLNYFGDNAWVNINNLKKVAVKKTGNSTGIEKRMAKNTVIICVGKKLHLTLTKMKKNETYHFSLFAINNKTNFTTLYGKSYIEYNYKPKPIALKDGKRRVIDLKKHSGEVYFKFKAYKKVREINFYVLVCGGAVQAEFTRRDRKEKSPGWNATKLSNKANLRTSTKLNATRVYGYQRFSFTNPGDYILKVSAPDTDERNRVEYVEVFATKHPLRYPLPAIPKELRIYEYRSRRRCDSITIGWIPEPDNTVNKYCVTVRENKRVDLADKYRASYQCHLDSRNSKGFSSFPPKYAKKNYVYRKCKEQQTKKRISVTNHTITKLKPGKSYTIQVTVEKKNGRTLSYELLKAVTKHSCYV